MIRPSCALTSVMLMMSSAIVVATSGRAARRARLKNAAMASATRGVRARVETEVAIALAASWKPLV